MAIASSEKETWSFTAPSRHGSGKPVTLQAGSAFFVLLGRDFSRRVAALEQLQGRFCSRRWGRAGPTLAEQPGQRDNHPDPEEPPAPVRAPEHVRSVHGQVRLISGDCADRAHAGRGNIAYYDLWASPASCASWASFPSGAAASCRASGHAAACCAGARAACR